MISENLTANFSESEIEAAIRKLKNGKAIDNKRMPAEIIKNNRIFFTKFFKRVFDEIIMKNDEMPDDWLNAILILLHKDGDRKQRSNYRPICLVSMAYKVLTIIITTRISPIMNLVTTELQAAYKKNRSTYDTLKILEHY